MERLGIPAALVMTEPFQRLATSFSVTLGMPGYPAVMVPHPVSTLTPEGLDKLADQVADQVAAHLTGG